LETLFAIKEDFTDFNATRWAIRELKHHRLKQLFKLVTSTAYERLVQIFYENLIYDYNRSDVLSSSIDDRDIEVTVADIVAALKCNVECPEAKEQWITYPSMLNTEEIVEDMCEGHCADQYQNATSKVKLPSQLWLVDFVLQRNVCPLGHKT
jgi:hypothetical protein